MQKGMQQGMAEEVRRSISAAAASLYVSVLMRPHLQPQPGPITLLQSEEILCVKDKAQNEYCLQACWAWTWNIPAFKTPFTTAQNNWKQKDGTNLSDQHSPGNKTNAVSFEEAAL